MNFRKIISLSIGLSFIMVFITGILSYFQIYSRSTATIHTAFGVLFSLGIVFHLRNNFRSVKIYGKSKASILIIIVGFLIFLGALYQVTPFNELMNFGAKQKASSKNTLSSSVYQTVEMNMNNDILLTIDLLRSEHYWHPQMAVWVEDEFGNYVETLFVSKATAKGLFFGGRSKSNFKDFDESKKTSGAYRRVNALPIWSYQRDEQYPDGLYVPSSEHPLPDAITGETITGSFKLLSSITRQSKFKLKIEINVAFDDNEFFSEYDFPDDKTFHNGTGQLGQPSIIFEVEIDMNDGKNYYLMDLIGHGHHSGQDGNIYSDVSKLTTAKHIVKRILIEVTGLND